MEKLKIGYFADGPWSHKAFEKIVNDKELEIQFIVPRSDTEDCTLQKYAETYNIPFIKGAKINSDEFYDLVSLYYCDLFVSMSFNQIFKDRIINLPKLKTINCHAGKLPFYRGRNIINWALINDETEFGITAHYIDNGIDTGDIILQKTFQIRDEDNYKSLLNIAFSECANVLYEAIKLIQLGKVNPIQQESIHPVGFYCGKRQVGDEYINWNKNSREIFNLIRAICDPGPKATTFFENKEIKINKAYLIDNAPKYINTPGQIVGKTSSGFIVKTKDSTILIEEVESDIKLKVGDRLG